MLPNLFIAMPLKNKKSRILTPLINFRINFAYALNFLEQKDSAPTDEFNQGLISQTLFAPLKPI